MFDSILIVCTGNICRSPIGERLLRKKLPGRRVDSAGTGALVNESADNNAIKVASLHGLSLEGHVAQQITSSMIRSYDLILPMEKSHILEIGRISPESRGKIMLFGHWLHQRDVPDPYRKSQEAFISVYKLIDEAACLWAKKLGS
ncbi:protein tyrosine phosphatase [Pluralibacter gergoviae]|uniref:arsenate reductase/protein-tyrosine-phosphatase family protein n=1 Tax=Pluralibacter gergoviae TaxID=61647 RepID=UPI00330AAB79|nr:protein tyrosine phosphatase [Pluralibacter gergoviae]